jgi:hypothetical protein
MIKRFAVAALALFIPLAVASCGADSTGDLDKGDLSKELQKDANMSKAQADCVADALIKADFTKDEIDKLSSGDEKSIDTKKSQVYIEAAMKCLTS